MDRYLTAPAICEALNISKQTLWRWVREGSFPAPVQLSPRKIAFRETDVRRWEASRPAAMCGGSPAQLCANASAGA